MTTTATTTTATTMKKTLESRNKVYVIPIRSITSNTNPRQALSASLDSQGWTVFVGDKALWPLAVSNNHEDRAKFVQLIADFDPEIVAMAATMLSQGQLQPVEVREGGSTKGDPKYTLVYGCRRCLSILYNWCSTGKPKEPVVNATLQKGNESTLLQRAIVENIRKQPSVIEEARTIRMLINNGQEIGEVAKELGYSLSTINKRLELLELPEKTQKKIKEGKVTATQAIAEANGHGERPKMRSRKEIVEAIEEFRDDSPERAVFDWLLCKREKIR
jgi:ParB/RepB/Spo0J family partition protein